MGQCIKCYRNVISPCSRAVLSCFGCKRCCFRPTDEDLISEFCIYAKSNNVKGLENLAGRIRILKGEKYKIGKLCSQVPTEPASSNYSDIENARRMNALHTAAMNDNLEILLVILKMNGCDPNQFESPCHYTALHFAAKEGFTATANLLIKYNVDVNALDWKKNTALLLSAANGHKSIVKTLIDHGAKINLRNCNGFNALIASIINGRRECALLLIKLGSDLEITDVHGNTPLHLAIMKGSQGVVKFLLQCGAQVYKFNKFQTSTLDEAKRAKSLEILTLIESAWVKHRQKVIALRDVTEEEED